MSTDANLRQHGCASGHAHVHIRSRRQTSERPPLALELLGGATRRGTLPARSPIVEASTQAALADTCFRSSQFAVRLPACELPKSCAASLQHISDRHAFCANCAAATLSDAVVHVQCQGTCICLRQLHAVVRWRRLLLCGGSEHSRQIGIAIPADICPAMCR